MSEQINGPKAGGEAGNGAGAGNEALALRVQKGDFAAAGPLWRGVQRLVYGFASRFFVQHRAACASAGVEPDDLRQESYFAVCDAARDYDPAKGWRFTSYLPLHLRDRFNALLGFRGGRSARLLNDAKRLDEPLPLNDEGDAATMLDLLPSAAAQAAFEGADVKLYRQQLHAAMQEALETLTPTERRTVTSRYYEDLTRAQIGRLFGLDAERVRQIEMNALQHLRRPAVLRRLRPFAVDYGAAYEGTGWGAWKRRGSVEERLVERAEERAEKE